MGISHLRVNYWLKAIGKLATGECVEDTTCRVALFKADNGEAMSFMLNAETSGTRDLGGGSDKVGIVAALGRLVVACGGRLELPASAVRLRLHRVAIMVDTTIAPLAVHFDGAYTFKMQYILDCVEEGALLNLSSYIETKPMMNPSVDLSKNHNFFYDVFYWRKSKLPQPVVLDNLDNAHQSGSKSKSPDVSIAVESDEEDDEVASKGSWISCSTAAATQKMVTRGISSSSKKVRRRRIAAITDDSDDDDLISVVRSMDSDRGKPAGGDKHSRAIYSRLEKEAILKFIVAKKAYGLVKGNRLYIDMEAHNICPNRTYQSMRNHFLKTIVRELDTFKFLSAEQKMKLRDG